MKTIFRTFLIVSVLAGTACNSKKNSAEVVEALPKVAVEAATTEKVIYDVSFTGNVEAEVVNNISSASSRRISRILVDVGDRVKAGQVLVELDRSDLIRAQAQYENTKIEYERATELYELGGASKSEYDARQLQYDVAKAQYDNLLENTTLISPVSGVVSARNYDDGDMTGGPVLTVEQISPVKILVGVSESLFAKVHNGMKVYVTLDAYGDEKFAGSVTRIYPTIDPTTRTFKLEVSLPNRDERVRPGMFARVTIPYGSSNSVVVTDRAVQKLMGSGDRYVYIYNREDGTVRYSKVELGRRLDAKYEIVSGLNAGEEVVTKGHLALTNGMKVELE